MPAFNQVQSFLYIFNYVNSFHKSLMPIYFLFKFYFRMFIFLFDSMMLLFCFFNLMAFIFNLFLDLGYLPIDLINLMGIITAFLHQCVCFLVYSWILFILNLRYLMIMKLLSQLTILKLYFLYFNLVVYIWYLSLKLHFILNIIRFI